MRWNEVEHMSDSWVYACHDYVREMQESCKIYTGVLEYTARWLNIHVLQDRLGNACLRLQHCSLKADTPPQDHAVGSDTGAGPCISVSLIACPYPSHCMSRLCWYFEGCGLGGLRNKENMGSDSDNTTKDFISERLRGFAIVWLRPGPILIWSCWLVVVDPWINVEKLKIA